MPDTAKMDRVCESNDAFFDGCGVRVLSALRRIIRAVDLHSRHLLTEHQVTTPQMICLYALAANGRMTLTELSRRVRLNPSTVNGIIDRLEVKHLVLRERCTVDRRLVRVTLTQAGRELTLKAPPLLQDSFSERLRALPDLEQAAIALSLERVVDLMEAGHLDASPNLLAQDPVAGIRKDSP